MYSRTGKVSIELVESSVSREEDQGSLLATVTDANVSRSQFAPLVHSFLWNWRQKPTILALRVEQVPHLWFFESHEIGKNCCGCCSRCWASAFFVFTFTVSFATLPFAGRRICQSQWTGRCRKICWTATMADQIP